MSAEMKERSLRERALAYRTEKLVLGLDRQPASVEFDGARYYVRPVTVGQRGSILRAAGFDGTGKSPVNLAELQVRCIIELIVDIDGRPVFEAADYAALANAPVGGVVDVLSPLATTQLNVSGDVGKN
jgi:hypothetical protein